MARAIHRAKRCAVVAWVAAMAAAALPSSGGAFTLKSLIMPGKVIEAHASIEDHCDSCHESKDGEKQSALCFVCHEDVRADIASKSGFHGRNAAVVRGDCATCHGEHEGREADITGLDPQTFDHLHTNFPLLGAHAGATCSGCHAAGVAYRAAPLRCSGCHEDDDAHAGALGASCEACHTTGAWAQADFDHAKTGFALTGAHRGAACAGCHRDQRFAGTPTQCLQCHRDDDAHSGRNGTECGTCHDASAWPVAAFDHAALAGFRLSGKHAELACESCHVQSLAAALPRTCVGCHESDDAHAGRLGTSCGDCHRSTEWAATSFEHAEISGFALTGAHAALACTTCHESGLDAALGRQCSDCHEDGDPHRGQLGARCDSCHSDGAWLTPIRFDHDLAAFPLLGKHSTLACAQCHASAAFRDAGETCAACHAQDDPHEGRFAPACAACHNPSGWEAWAFDHDRETGFALTGAHRDVACDSCHRAGGTQKNAALRARGDDCGQCHRRDDPHRGQFGADCGACHSTESFADLRGR